MALELQRAELADLLVHDLRNPLTSIMGGLDLILGAPEINDETRADAALASEGAATLLRLVNDILDVNRCEAGRMLLALDQCAPAEIVRTAITQMAHLARRQGVDLRVTVANGLPPVLADGTKLRRLLVNLVANAIQHTPRGGRVAVTAQASASDAAIVLTVEDTGAGIPPEVLPRLFEKYGRAKQDRSSGMSTGLGLYFCKLVADAHGGRIEGCSRVGTGTVFTVTIPLCPAGSAGRASVF